MWKMLLPVPQVTGAPARAGLIHSWRRCVVEAVLYSPAPVGGAVKKIDVLYEYDQR